MAHLAHQAARAKRDTAARTEPIVVTAVAPAGVAGVVVAEGSGKVNDASTHSSSMYLTANFTSLPM